MCRTCVLVYSSIRSMCNLCGACTQVCFLCVSRTAHSFLCAELACSGEETGTGEHYNLHTRSRAQWKLVHTQITSAKFIYIRCTEGSLELSLYPNISRKGRVSQVGDSITLIIALIIIYIGCNEGSLELLIHPNISKKGQ